MRLTGSFWFPYGSEGAAAATATIARATITCYNKKYI